MVLKEFRTGTALTIATDVASRGIDVKDIRYVINYDFPKTLEDYASVSAGWSRGNDRHRNHFHRSAERFKNCE